MSKTANQASWITCRTQLPIDGRVVETKIEDENGARNQCTLFRRGNLWFFPDASMYVYYTPTHWRIL
jgi:hypothetical protein